MHSCQHGNAIVVYEENCPLCESESNFETIIELQKNLDRTNSMIEELEKKLYETMICNEELKNQLNEMYEKYPE